MKFAVVKPLGHKELVFEVIGVAGQLDDRSRVWEAGQVVEPVALSPLIWASLEAEEIEDVCRSGDLPLML